MDGIRRQTLTTTMPLDQSKSGWYCETTITNLTATPIFVMRPGGQVDEIAPLYVGRGFGQEIVLKQVVKVGVPIRDIGLTTGQHTVNTPKYPLVEITVDVRKLSTGPLFIPDIGVTVCLPSQTHRLKEMNYLDPEMRARTIDKVCSEYLKQGCASPLTIIANSHDLAINFFYVEINGKVMSVLVRHDLDVPETLTLKVARNATVTSIPIESLDWSKLSVQEATIFGRTWIMGTDLEAVQKRAIARYRAEINKKTESEVQQLLEESKTSLASALDDAKRRIENLSKELELTKQDLKNTKSELEKANSASRYSYEQEQLKTKLETLEAERRLLNMKRDIQQEEARLKSEQHRYEAEANREATQTRMEKERMSLQSEKLSAWTSVAKALAVIIPLIVTGVVWVMKHKVVAV